MIDVKELIKFTNDDVVDFADAFCTEGKIGQGPSILLRDGTVYSLDNHDTHLDFFLALYHYKADSIRDEYAEDEVDYELDMLEDDDFIMDMVERDLGIITLNLGLTRGESRPKIVVLTKPTDAQYEVLREFLERVQSFKKYVVVFIGEDSTYKEYRFDDETDAKDILNKIKAYFSSGNLRESDDESLTESVIDYDSEGNQLSQQQVNYFKNSKIRDDEGKLLVVYHGTDKNFDNFNVGDIGFHFGTKGQADYVVKNNLLNKDKGHVDAYYLNIKNPALMYDFGPTGPYSIAFWWWSQSFDDYGQVFDFDMTKKELAQINKVFYENGGITFGTGNEETDITNDAAADDCDQNKDKHATYNSPEAKLLRELLKKRGYDGIYYYNNFEDADESNAISYIAFEPNQIKRISNLEPTSSNNINEGKIPEKTGKAYKVFRVKNGKLYPPMVANPGGQDTPIGVWLDAQEGEFAGLSKTGRPQVKSTGSGNLAYRPGWHLGDIPRAKQFDRFNKETGEYEFPKDFVWAECDYAMDVDYQPEADEQGYMRTKVDDKGEVQTYRSDKYQHSLAGLKKLPTGGYYKYRTNPNPDTVPWVITGQMKVNRLLSDDEVNDILVKNGIEPIHRQGGDKTLAELGLKESLMSESNKITAYRGEGNGAGGALYGYGKYYASSKEDASKYGKTSKYEISLDNPLTIDGKDTLDSFVVNNFKDEVEKEVPGYYGEFHPFDSLPQGVSTKIVKNLGYDGIIVEFEDGSKHYVVFDDKAVVNLNESIISSERFDMLATDNPYEVKDYLKRFKTEGARIFIDERLPLYLVCNVYEATHHDMIDLAIEQGYGTKFDDFDEKKVCVLYYPKTADVNYLSDVRDDDYDHAYEYADAVVFSRYNDFNTFELSDVLGQHETKEVSEYLTNESLNESKQDSENFKKWLNDVYDKSGAQWSDPLLDVSDVMSSSEKCFSLFDNYRKDNTGKETDYYYWMKKNPEYFFSFLAEYARKIKEKNELIDKETSGAERIAENKFWYVYKITSYEASRKYGRNTTWCITDKYDWDSYRDDWGIEYFLFFIPKDDSKYMRHAVGVSNDAVQMIFNQEDCKVEGIPNVPELPDDYPQVPNALDYDFYTYFDCSDDITASNIKDAAEAGVDWLQYLWFLGNEEEEIKDILKNDFHVAIDESVKESLNEAKADTERFLKWISDGYKSMKYSDWASGVYAKEAVEVFNKYKNSLKGEQRDIYAWMKKPFSEFASLVSALKKKDDEKSETFRKEDEGARLVYKDDDWYVYEITTYEASKKYGASTKWCISGSKRWQNGQNGEKFWKEYFDDNGIRFYFFIDRKNGGKYALAAYPDGEHYEIYNDEDIRVPFIPNAPLVKELLDMFGTHEAFYANSDTTKEIEFAFASKDLPVGMLKYAFDEIGFSFGDYQNVEIFEGVGDFIAALDADIPDGYLEWEAVTQDKMTEEEYEALVGEKYSDDWTGDLPIIENFEDIPEWWLGKESALRKSNFKPGMYALVPGDYNYMFKTYKNSKDLILDASTSYTEGNLVSELAKVIVDSVSSGELEPKEVVDVFGLSEDDLANLTSIVGKREGLLCEEILYHGSTQKGIDTFKSPINWVTDDIDYAKYYATSLNDEGSVYTFDVNLGNVLNVGKTGVRAYSMLPVKPYRPSPESKSLANKLGLSDGELSKLLSDVCDEFDLDNGGYKMMLSTIVRSNAFAKILREKGYDSISAIEYNVPKGRYCKTYGILNELRPIDEMDVKYESDEIEEDIEKHDTLNQKLFDGDELRQDVKDKIIEIANAFVDELATDDIKFDLKDIVLVGSNVSYNYTKDSDLDIHLIADSKNLHCPDELYPLLYSAYRSIFNKNYDIKIKGIPAEVYVEMDEPQGKSNGVYSINDGWVKKPVQTSIPDIDNEKFDGLFSEWEDRYFELVDEIEAELGSTEHPLDESLKRVDK